MLPVYLFLFLIPLAWAQSPAGNQSPNPQDQSQNVVDTNLDPNGVAGSPAGNQSPNPNDHSQETVDQNLDPNGVHGSPAGNQDPNPAPTPEPVDTNIDPNNVQFQDGIDPNNLSPPERPSESTPGDLYVCTDTQFGGDCEYFHALTYNCYNLADKFKHKLTSIRPDKNQMCQFYDSDNCVGDSDWIRWPGSGNMRGRRFDNRAASWTCSDDSCDGVQGPGGCTKNADGTLKGADPVGDAAKGWDPTREQ